MLNIIPDCELDIGDKLRMFELFEPWGIDDQINKLKKEHFKF